MIEIKSYSAKNGDGYLVKASASPFAMLIDGGYAETFHRHIRCDLENLAANNFALDVVVYINVCRNLASVFPAEAPSHPAARLYYRP